MQIQGDSLKIESCYLVTEKLTVDRRVKYYKRDFSATMAPSGAEDAEWRTERHYANKLEAAEADQVYAKARYKIRSVCVATDVGFICPLRNEGDLRQAIEEARELVDEANKRFKFCSIRFNILVTKIEAGNADGSAIVADTIARSVQDVRQAALSFDVKDARNVLNTTKGLLDVIAEPAVKAALVQARTETQSLLVEVQHLIKQYDGNVQNALASTEGQVFADRIGGAWDIFSD